MLHGNFKRTKLNGLENLETRNLMAADLVGDILYIDGSNAGDQIEVRFDESGVDEVHVDINGDDDEFDLDDVHEIRVRGLGGNDVIRGQQGQDEFVQYGWYNVFTGGTYNTENDTFLDFESGDTVRYQLGAIFTIGYLVI